MSTQAHAVRVVAPPVRRTAGGMAEVALLSFPAVLQTLSDTMMQVVDSAIVGRLGVTELGAVGLGGIWLWTFLVPFFGCATGVQTFVAQAFGGGHRHECGSWVWQALYALMPAAVAFTLLLAVLFDDWLRLLGTTPGLHQHAAAYADGRLWGIPAVVAGVAFTACFRGIGDTHTPLVAAVVANLVNATLSYGLVLGRFGLPALGVLGAGIGTALANWVYAGIMLAALLRPHRAREYRTFPTGARGAAIRRYLRTSAPIGGQWLLDMVSFALFSTLVARMGDASMAASQAMIQLLSLSFMQAFGISIAAGALVGRYVGARDPRAAARSHRSALQLGLGLAMVVGVLFVSAPDTLLGVFTTDPAVLAMGRPLLALGAVYQAIDAVGIIASGSLRGAGDTRWPFVVQASLAWAVRLPLVALLTIGLDGGVLGAWVGELVYIAALCAAFLVRFHGGAWRTARI